MKRTTKAETLSVEDAARLLGICYASGLKMAKRGDLPVIRPGKRFLILKAPFLEMLKSAPSKDVAA